nr:reverse transcriptase domain-containing protein [Tanacetum cinerariifolium]
PLTQAAICRMIKENVDDAITAERARQANAGNDARGSEPVSGPTLTWWNAKITTMGMETMNKMPWTEMKQLMTAKLCPIEEVHRIEHELWNLKVKEYNIVAYTKRFNELALMCSRMVKPERVKVDAYIQKVKQAKVGEVHGRAYVMKDAMSKGPNVVTDMFLLNNRYAFVLFDSGSDRSFMDTRFSFMLNINPIKIGASYEVELADRRVVSTNTILKGCTLNLVNHIFEIDLMPIELSTFDVIISMNWLVKNDVIIVCGEKVVHIPYGSTILIVESDKGVSRLKVIHRIKA